MPESAKDAAWRLAARQHGVLASRQLRELGLTKDAIWRLTRSGLLCPAHGVLRLVSFPVDHETALWAAVLRSQGVLSQRTAARRFGADLPAEMIDVTVRGRSGTAMPPGVRLHHSRRLPNNHVTYDKAGLPLTTPPRTFVDIALPAVGLTDHQLIACLDAWITGGSVTMRWLEWFLDNETTQLLGRVRAVRVVESISGQRVDSRAERELAGLLVDTGFVTQHPIRHEGRVVARVDFAWPAEQLALELDGYRFHSSPTSFVSDRQRGNVIGLAGWALLRTTPAEVRSEPQRLLETVAAAIAARRGPGAQ